MTIIKQCSETKSLRLSQTDIVIQALFIKLQTEYTGFWDDSDKIDALGHFCWYSYYVERFPKHALVLYELPWWKWTSVQIITAEILVFSLANFHLQLVDRHVNL